MNKLLTLAVLAPLLIAGIIAIADAVGTNITGNVKSGGVNLNDAKATAERIGEYKWDRTNTSGNYDLLTSTTNLYTVDSMKGGFTRDSDEVAGGNTAPNQSLNTREQIITVHFKIAHDGSTSVTETEARNELLRAEPWFDEEHSIIFDEFQASESWTSAEVTSNDSCDLLTELRSDIGWNSPTNDWDGADILFGVSDGKITGTASKACANAPTEGGTHPAAYVDISGTSFARDRTVAHELSHNYGFEHMSSCSNLIPSIMAVTDTQQCDDYIINWQPSHDTTLENRRTWY